MRVALTVFGDAIDVFADVVDVLGDEVVLCSFQACSVKVGCSNTG